MAPNEKQQTLLQMLPGVDRILELAGMEAFFEAIPQSVVVSAIRRTVAARRAAILAGDPSVTADSLSDIRLLGQVKRAVGEAMRPNLRRVVNATGVVVHTNLGRSLLAPEAVANLVGIAGCYSNLEYDLAAGQRGSRYSCVEDILCEVSTAEAAMVVNNNAGAVLLCLETIAQNRTVIVSRGELVEIGGSFRIPDVMSKSGAHLKEVGTTNRTHLKDYANALDENTALLLKVHRSNYSVVGFTAEVRLADLVKLGAEQGVAVMEDLGSGTFVDFSKYGLPKEPTVQESVATGVDIVTFSGDKLLGGPQAGIILGRKHIIDRIRRNPLTRALRIDKLTLAALEATLRLYRDEEKAVATIPTLQMLMLKTPAVAARARRLVRRLKKTGDPRLQLQSITRSSKAGGGALPLLDLPSRCVGVKIQGLSANSLQLRLRQNEPPVIGRIEEDFFMLDLRTVQDDEIAIIETAFKRLLQKIGHA